MKLFATLELRFLCITLLFTSAVFGQQPAGFQVFFEKVYLHTDRNFYTAGEDMWFRAYLVNAQTGIRSNTSANLYVELLSPFNEVVVKETLHLENGLANGDFKIPSDIGGGKFRLRAYTNWMKNFSDQFFFEKEVEIVADPEVKTVQPKSQPTILATAINTASVGLNQLYFFAEGGAMVTGIPCNMAFKAVDANGKGVRIKGKVLASNGDSVAALNTSHAGFGNFTFTPLPNMTYTASGKFYGMELFSKPLPAALNSGFTLHMQETKNGDYIATIQADAATARKAAGIPLRMMVRRTGKVLVKDSVILDGQKGQLTIPRTALQEGINAITLYDEQLRPQCERLIYVKSTNPITITLATDQADYSPQQKTTIELTLTNAQKQPIQGRISAAVTDANLIPPGDATIVSFLMLQSELHGEIENPRQYFDSNNPNRWQQLDLLLQTQGWREFIWRRLVDSGFSIKYLPEPGITISGRVEKKFGKSGLKDMNITLFAGNARGDKIYFTKTDANGRFFLDGLPLYGSQNIKLTARNADNKKEGMLLMDTIQQKPYTIKNINNIIYDTSAQHQNFLRYALAQNKRVQAQKDKDAHELENVTVTAGKPKIRLVDGGVKYGKADSLFNIDASDKQYQTLSNFIIGRYPGAYSDAERDGFFFYGERNSKVFPKWVIEGREDRSMENSSFPDVETGEMIDRGERIDYNNIPIDKVKSVYIVPMISNIGNMMYTVQLSLLPGALEAYDLALINTNVTGYYEARTYFVPNNTPTNGFSRTDLRSTIYWKPDLKTNSDGKTSFNYRNSDAKTAVSVWVEGITDQGIPFVGTLKYNVK